MKEKLKTGFDIIFIIFPDNNIEYSYEDRENQIVELFEKARLFL